MRHFRSAPALCAALLLSLFLCAPTLAQAPPDSLTRDIKTWITLNSLVSEIRAIRLLAVDARNAAAQNPAQAARDQNAYQNRLQTIRTKCNSIGYADLLAYVDFDSSLVSRINFSGTIQGNPLLDYASMSLAVLQPSTAAQITIQIQLPPWGAQGVIKQQGVIRINQNKTLITTSDTYQTMLNKIMNNASINGLTVRNVATSPAGVVSITIAQLTPGSQFPLRIQDANGFLLGPPLKIANGIDAVATLTLTPLYSADGLQTIPLFGGSEPGDSGLTLRDEDGTRLDLMQIANVVSENLPFGCEGYFHFGPESLGVGIVAGGSLANIYMTTQTSANDAIQIVDLSLAQMAQLKQSFLQAHPKFHPL